jgi:hypothetical protein
MSITLDQETTSILIEEEFKALSLVHRPTGRQQKAKVMEQAVKNISEVLKDETKFKEWLQSKK